MGIFTYKYPINKDIFINVLLLNTFLSSLTYILIVSSPAGLTGFQTSSTHPISSQTRPSFCSLFISYSTRTSSSCAIASIQDTKSTQHLWEQWPFLDYKRHQPPSLTHVDFSLNHSSHFLYSPLASWMFIFRSTPGYDLVTNCLEHFLVSRSTSSS